MKNIGDSRPTAKTPVWPRTASMERPRRPDGATRRPQAAQGGEQRSVDGNPLHVSPRKIILPRQPEETPEHAEGHIGRQTVPSLHGVSGEPPHLPQPAGARILRGLWSSSRSNSYMELYPSSPYAGYPSGGYGGVRDSRAVLVEFPDDSDPVYDPYRDVFDDRKRGKKSREHTAI
uniref:Uncharacterized protein LOC111119620 isoform X2 n=1 Tax=Crassostrea virginica TaxID=6565 RepID=A0A8B8CIM1_CRAVI|nr:uncharacterized protein LOC111119620 isoform X2 [Crassostrea virginica]